MDGKDRDRLALSTGIALVGYAVIFLLLGNIDWPSISPFPGVAPPVSVYVNLGAPEPIPLAAVAPVTRPPVVSSTTRNARESVSPHKTVSAPKPTPPPAETAAAPASTPAATSPTPQSSSSAASPSAAEPSAASGAAPSPAPRQAPSSPIPTSSTSTAGPLPFAAGGQANPSGSSSASGSPPSGSGSPAPGVNYPVETGPGPAQGSGGSSVTQESSAQSQNYVGPSTASSGGFFNPELAAQAGTSQSPAPAAAGSATAAQAGTTASGVAGSGTSAAGAGASTASSGAAGGGAALQGGAPQILWQDSSSTREVLFEPGPFVVPKKDLSELPPKIDLTINFQVEPGGSVNVLNITPSLGYPELYSALETWMERWRFQPVSGNQVARGKLQYVIQAVTAR